MVTALAVGRPSHAASGWAAGLLSVALGACFPGDRPLAPNIVCESEICSCVAGYDDCDAIAENGCESDLRLDARHCGACGVRCQNGLCLSGECVASEGYVDCNDDPGDGFEAHLATDPLHCGACGHDCMGGACTDGHCDPFLLSEPGIWTWWITTDATHVYLCEFESGAIVRIGQQERDAEVLAVDQDCVDKVAMAGDAVFWATHNEYLDEMLVVEGSIAEHTTSILGRGEVIGSVRASADVVAWITPADDGSDDATLVARVGTDADPAVLYRTGNSLGALVIVGEDIYFLEIDGNESPPRRRLMRVSIYGATLLDPATAVADLGTGGIQALRATETYVCWVEWLTPPEEGGAYKIMQLTLGDAEPVERYRGVNHPATYVSLDADASGLYWAERGGASVFHLAPEAESPEEIARYAVVDALAVAPRALFWSDGSGRLYGLAKEGSR